MTIECLILQQLYKMFWIIATGWFEENGMKANPNKFQFMILSPNATDDIKLKLDKISPFAPKDAFKLLASQ